MELHSLATRKFMTWTLEAVAVIAVRVCTGVLGRGEGEFVSVSEATEVDFFSDSLGGEDAGPGATAAGEN